LKLSEPLSRSCTPEPKPLWLLTVLVCELSHYLPEELFSVLQGRTIRHLLFNHLAPELNGREVELLRGARAALPQIGEITAVGDGERIWF
jgi:hypothetical protein